jgi:hypothetical protein
MFLPLQNLRRKTPLTMLLLALCFLACNKNDKPAPSPEEQLAEKRKTDAVFNNGLTPGIGNVFYEEKLVANASSQLIFKMAYYEDTLAAYGKINSSGQLEYINATVLAKKGNSELLVTETFPGQSKSRMYSIINHVKSNIVVEVDHYTKSKFTISVLDLNWSTGEKKILKSTYISDGAKTSEFSGLRLAGGDRVWNCDQPQPSDDLNQTVDNHLDYHACGGLAWDTHPSLTAIKEAVTSSIEALKNIDRYKDKLPDLQFLQSAYNQMSSLFAATSGKIKGYKFEKTRLAGLLKELQDLINKLKEEQVKVSLVPFEALMDTDYDEVTDNEVKMVFTVTDDATGLPFTKEPVFVDMAFIVPGTNRALKMESKASSVVNGLITFKFDPTTIAGYEQYTSLEAKWGFSSDNWQKTATRTVTLKYIRPKIVFANGNALPSSIKFFTDQTQLFKLINEDGREINANYNDITVNSNSNSRVNYVLMKGDSDFSLKLSTNEPNDQFTALDIFYKGRFLTTINAVVTQCNASTTPPVINSYALGCSSAGEIKIDVAFTANGPGILTGSGSGYCDPAQDCYPVRLYFLNPGATEWSIAYNGYSAKLLSGTVNNGVVEVSIYKNCLTGKSAGESLQAYYPNYQWKIELMNKCGQRSAQVQF